MSNPLGDLFDGLGLRNKAQSAQDTMKEASERLAAQRKKTLKLPQLRKIRKDGVVYIRAEDVGALLTALGDKRLSALAQKLKEM